jgi:hypothetical protein
MFAKIENGSVVQYPYTLEQMHSDNPDTSFPQNISVALHESFGVFKVDYEGAPEFDPLTHRIEHSSGPLLVDGKWMLTKTVVAKTQEQMDADAAGKSAQIRQERNAKLSETDWTQVADAPVDQAAWAAYRQALRDVTAQAGFPWSVEWPTQP